MGEFDHALNNYHQLLKMDEECLSPDHLDRSTDLDMVVNIYKRMGKTEEAMNFCRTKLNNQRNVLGEIHPCIARTLITMADALEEENPNESLEYYKQALSVWEQLTSPDYRVIYQCLTSMSCLYSRNDMINGGCCNSSRLFFVRN
jgi:tetratricopeptide (TPR) repeat protein